MSRPTEPSPPAAPSAPSAPTGPPGAGQAGPPLLADLVLEGGGVKGVGLVGAVVRLAEAGYSFPRVAGSSAGAIVAALVAALQRAGEPVTRLAELARELDYRAMRDGGLPGRFGPPGLALNLLRDEGLYEGRALRRYLTGQLADLGVSTFGDLRLPPDADADLPPEQRYRLVVTATDVSRGRLAYLPWDARSGYGRDPDELSVATAVGASAAIPFYFEPVRLRTGSGARATLVDGGVVSNFPIAIFDRTDDRGPRWPTFGVRLSEEDEDPVGTVRPVTNPVTLLVRLLETLVLARDRRRADQPCARRRTTYVDTAGVSAVDFDITAAQRERLVRAGRDAAEEFLAGWDFPDYVAACR